MIHPELIVTGMFILCACAWVPAVIGSRIITKNGHLRAEVNKLRFHRTAEVKITYLGFPGPDDKHVETVQFNIDEPLNLYVLPRNEQNRDARGRFTKDESTVKIKPVLFYSQPDQFFDVLAPGCFKKALEGEG